MTHSAFHEPDYSALSGRRVLRAANSDVRRLIVFTRYPEPGKAKTRMIPALGIKRAAELHGQMTRHTLDWAREFRRETGVRIEVHYTGGNDALMRHNFGGDLTYVPQVSGDLGARLTHAVHAAFGTGARQTVVIGSDAPGLNAAILHEAFERLARNDLVLGPAVDGGYYLVGLSRSLTAIFSDIQWGTAAVLRETLEASARIGSRVSLLETLPDVDLPEDLWIWDRRVRAPRIQPEMISIIVPALNEGSVIAQCLAPLTSAERVEVIVADGGSNDHTRELASACGARVIQTDRGRARQMNAAAAVARGEIFLFVHADTRLQRGFEAHIRRLLREPGVSAGAFEFQVNSDEWRYRLLEILVARRSRALQLPYGDQGLFMRSEMFHEMGGFPDLALMEDFALVRSLSRRGRIVISPLKAMTSARWWEHAGVLRGTLVNQLCIAAFLSSVPASEIAVWRKWLCG